MTIAQTISVAALVVTFLAEAQLPESQQPKKQPVPPPVNRSPVAGKAAKLPPGLASWKTPAALSWTTRDSGRDVSYDEAHAYCAELTLDGFSDWRLPTDAELRTLYRPNDKPTLVIHNHTGPHEIYIDKHIKLERVYAWVDYELAH